ncbi:uncharacterized protein DDB_G0284459-like [Sorghum bicolor]|uniref:uncharacterized protein DDB_G0284459-like n=1 Tax=Sorghum bicolor TaxID=4558 RepID=UPI000B424305|nr:uncharacterized protein DDB_G0284459-like [Sorghum bicolor]|eukprot:XP_021309111.1 uncharacterized protein DDB_G0284459-like [Sorghum bicolor]
MRLKIPKISHNEAILAFIKSLRFHEALRSKLLRKRPTTVAELLATAKNYADADDAEKLIQEDVRGADQPPRQDDSCGRFDIRNPSRGDNRDHREVWDRRRDNRDDFRGKRPRVSDHEGSIDARSSKLPVKEDDVDRDKRRESAEKLKSVKDLEKKKEKKKNLTRQALETRRVKSRQRGEPEEESPNEDDGADGDDDSDDSKGMVSRLDRILEDPPETGVDVPQMGVPKGRQVGLVRVNKGSHLRAALAPTPPSACAGLKRPLEQAQPSMAKRLKVGATSKDSGSSVPRLPTGVESASPRPLVGESTPPSPKQVEAPRPQEQEGAPKPPRSRIEGDPSTISDGSDGDRLSKDARSTDEKEGQQQPQQKREEEEEGRRQQGDQLEELLEQDRQQELWELQRQQR